MDCLKSVSSGAVRALAVLFLFAGAFLTVSCQPALYRVEPVRKGEPLTNARALTLGELKVSASGLFRDEDAFARFDSNLLLAGVLAVDLEIANSGNLDHQVRLELADSKGQRYKPMKASAVLKRMMSFEGVRMYAIEAKHLTLKNLEDQALGARVTVGKASTLRGTLFFDLKGDIASASGTSLRVDSGGQSASLPLN